MKTINFKTAERVYPMFRDIELGEIFTLPNSITPYMKGFMQENNKIKAINIQSGEIINLYTTTPVVPYEATINLTIKT